MAETRWLIQMIERVAIDRSSMGLAIFEPLRRELGYKVEGVQFGRAPVDPRETEEIFAVELSDRRNYLRERIHC